MTAPAVPARGLLAHSLYKWGKAVSPDKSEQQSKELLEAKSEILRLRAQVLRVARAGFYEWLRESVCDHAKEDARLLNLIRDSYAGAAGSMGHGTCSAICEKLAKAAVCIVSNASCANTRSKPYVAIRHHARSQVALPSLRLIICSASSP